MTSNKPAKDSASQVNTTTSNESADKILSNLLKSTREALNSAAQNAAEAQQQAQITMQNATVQGVNSLMAIPGSSIGRGAKALSTL